jgi:hypothetical protein
MCANRQLIILFVLIPGLLVSLPAAAQQIKDYQILFTRESSRPDTTLNEEIRQEWPDDDGSVLSSIPYDLNQDGRKEKFVCNFLCGSGGCNWVIWDPSTRRSLGIVDGSVIYIHRRKRGGYPILETFWRLGGDQALVYYYEFSKGKYKRTEKISLSGGEINAYFSKRPSVVDETGEQ